MPPKKDKKDKGEKKPKGEKKKPPRSEMCECGANEENEREPGWAKDDPRRGWVRVVPAASGKKGKKKKGQKEVINHNPGCTYQRAPCGKYPHMQKCPACQEGCPHCEKVIADCPLQASGQCRKCMFMYKRDVLKASTPLVTLPLASLAMGFGMSLSGPKKPSYLPGLKKSNIMVG
eukprot:TRINITY_DN3655_c0_g1_i1.p1 TRINITY_DN3655_c0_g1~~TRINITY_DN3655_c0_g1_i1.p1  ORF type:complete len:175 (+),score=79.14 TRINITY_DN3655_c0_g1_i1:63-587(+)